MRTENMIENKFSTYGLGQYHKQACDIHGKEKNGKCHENVTAILVVSFGSTHLDTLERCITATESAIAENFRGYPVYRAFLSPTVMRRLEESKGIHVDTVAEALACIEHDGYKQVIIQPTLLLGGIEYELLEKEVRKRMRITAQQVFVGHPLIENREDCDILASIIIEENPLADHEALMLMGHGTEHAANEVYHMMQEIFDDRGYRCFIGTVEGTPSFEDAVERLMQCKASHVKLLPLMFVAGDHAKNDMAGERDSLLTLVKAVGIQAEPILRGLGESRKVQNLYVARVEKAFEEAGICR